MASEDIQKTAIVTPFGMFKFLRMHLKPLEDFSQLVWCGLYCPEMWVFGLLPVSVASGVRSKLMFMPLFLSSLSLPGVSPTLIWISWDLFLLVMVSPIFSP